MFKRKKEVDINLNTEEVANNNEYNQDQSDMYVDYSDNNEEENNNIDYNTTGDIHKYQSTEKKYKDNYLERHTVVTEKSKSSRLILIVFYLLLIVIGVIVFVLLRSNRYQAYLDKDSVTINKGGSYQVELTPKHIKYFDYLNYKYEISDTNIATVDKFGTITAHNVGTTTLKVSLNFGLMNRKMTVDVKEYEINSINLMVYKDDKLQTIDSVNLLIGQSIVLKPVINDNQDINVTVEYSSSDPNVAVVDEFGNVTAKGVGTTKISGTKDGVVDEIIVNVEKNSSNTSSNTPTNPSNHSSTTTIKLSNSQITKYVGDTISLIPTVSPSSVSTSSIKWVSSNESVATVDQNGLIKTLKEGTAVITVSVGNAKANCKVIVKNKNSGASTSTPTPPPTATITAPQGQQISAKEVSLSKTSITLDKDKSNTFTIKVSGAAGVISVSSSDASIVTVSSNSSDCNNGKCFFDATEGNTSSIDFTVNGIKAGNAYINVALDDLVSYAESEITGSGKVGILVK